MLDITKLDIEDKIKYIMRMKNLKDKQFKSYAADVLEQGSLNNFNCDFEVDTPTKLFLLEYENSSRGLMSNVIKVMKCLKENPTQKQVSLVLLRTEHHQKSFNLDYNRALFLIDNIKIPNLQIQIMPEEQLDNVLNGIKKGSQNGSPS